MKRDKLLKFFEWVAKLSETAKYHIEWEGDAGKQIARYHITNPINMRRIKKNIQYIVNDPFNFKGKAPNDWHQLTYNRKSNQTIYTMDVNGKDRMAYIVKDNIIIFSVLEHQ